MLIALLSATLLFGAHVCVRALPAAHWRTWGPNWKGTVVAAALLVLYEGLFPCTPTSAHADNYGTIAAFAVVILVFFYYLAFILLLGAEVNSWVAGQRATASGPAGRAACGAGPRLHPWRGWPFRR